MIHIAAVDDEWPALKRVGKLLETMEGVQVSGLFGSAREMLEHALTKADALDLVLLDVEMPGMQGLELARRLRAVRPEIQVVFITAYAEFARDAFEVEAMDYLLKPVTAEDLEKTLARYARRFGRETSMPDREPSEPGLSVRSFGPFDVVSPLGSSVRFRNSKSRELLAYLHHHRGRTIGKSQILEDLWHGGDIERTQATLHSTVYQLRKDLEACGIDYAIEQARTAGGSYSLRWTVTRDDVTAFRTEYEIFQRTSSLTNVIRAIQLYGDGYLAGSGYAWAAPRQAELELIFIELLEAMANAYVRQQRYEIALNPLQKWAELLPLSGRLHAKMIALLLLTGKEKDARAYHELALELADRPEESELLDFDRLAAHPASWF
ncbi:response regulator [Cohnella sp. REN36]|uniref:response regulator n=1 Tax=Cohnella sp. REN36 TaxID=2887347 RepID=UPI001D142719|nr:response regulator [Cohnella sp. REN36]MCC3375453.1 response regulator [Cohnella sp. REN36]